MTGAGRRNKGHSFERLIATAYRKRWPDRVVRRSIQSHQAFEPDVVVEGVPLWTECQHATNASPLVKLAQAERDVRSVTEPIYPVVVWRKTGGRTINVTMRLGSMLSMVVADDEVCLKVDTEHWNHVITLDFDEWLECVEFASDE